MEIPYPQSTRLILDDCRRLTGPSLVWDKTGAILDVLLEDIEFDVVLDCWYQHLKKLQTDLGWQHREATHRRFESGFNLLIEAPVDALYSATLVLETAWYFTACDLLDVKAADRDELLEAIRQSIRDEANPALLALQQAAHDHGVDFLTDDDEVSVGHGTSSACWPVNDIPSPSKIDWRRIDNLPVALITGTNGKSTSVRILDSIAKAAGRISGVTSTDFVRVGDEVLDEGDYSGPGGARLLLRDKRLQVAFLEVARGGILRRGLPLRKARAALVTNVDRDHLGQYGVNTLDALIETKFVVRKGLAGNGVVVTNADDAGILGYMKSAAQEQVCWFSIDKNNPGIQQHMAHHGRCCYTDDGRLVYFDGSKEHAVCNIEAIPMTLGGAARHNISNALGAVGVASAMGFSVEAIRQGLTRFHSDPSDNPGRLNTFELKNGARVIIDFAHNAHSVAAVTDTVARIPAGRKWVLFSSAGDRSDEEIAAIAAGVCSLNPDTVVIAEVKKYLRGRKPGEVSKIMKRACIDAGVTKNRILLADSPLAGVKMILQKMQVNDLGLFLVLSERDEVISLLGEYSKEAVRNQV